MDNLEQFGSSLPDSPDLPTIHDRGQRDSEQQGESLARRRYQKGTVQRRGENWIGRWREDYVDDDGSAR